MSDNRTVPRPGHRPGDVRVRLTGRRAKLPRTLGAPALFSACYGNVGSSIYYALGVTAAFALGLTPLDLSTQLVLVVLGVFLLLNINTVISNIHWGVAPNWGKFLASISIAMVSYTGIEIISNMSEEANSPGRTVPRATWAVIAAVLFV